MGWRPRPPALLSGQRQSEGAMERREFLAAVPAAAVGLSWAGSAGAQTEADPLPGFQPPGVQRWERSDVQAGDRPVGASFGSRSEVLDRKSTRLNSSH